MWSLLLVAASALQVAAPPGNPSVVDQELMRAQGLQTRGDARELAGKLAVLGGALVIAGGAMLLAEPDMCDFDDETHDKGIYHDLTPRERCQVAGGVALGVGAISAGIGAWLWSSGVGLQDEAEALRRGPAPRTGAAPRFGLRVGQQGAFAQGEWRF